MARFYQLTAADLYRILVPQSKQNSYSVVQTSGVDAVCPEMLILFGKNLLRYGKGTLKSHASLLEVDQTEFRFAVKALTGKSYNTFVEDFLVFIVRESLGDFPEHGEIKKNARKLGFSESGLYRFMKRKMKRTPTGRTWGY
ncbi:MAG: hypothetical protein PHO94_13855 [Petrimonas sp.]|nr:hypothetical protein [Petrimonas sp.]